MTCFPDSLFCLLVICLFRMTIFFSIHLVGRNKAFYFFLIKCICCTRQVANCTAISLAKRSRNLTSLDLSWCRNLTDEAMGLIVDSCSSLKLLKLFGCTQVRTGYFPFTIGISKYSIIVFANHVREMPCIK